MERLLVIPRYLVQYRQSAQSSPGPEAIWKVLICLADEPLKSGHHVRHITALLRDHHQIVKGSSEVWIGRKIEPLFPDRPCSRQEWHRLPVVSSREVYASQFVEKNCVFRVLRPEYPFAES